MNKYYSITEAEGAAEQKRVRAEDLVDGTATMNDAPFVLMPDGTVVDMKFVRSILGEAIDTVIDMIDPSLEKYFRYLHIFYTCTLETFATTNDTLAINPGFALRLYKKGETMQSGGTALVAYVLMHECYHTIFGHCDDPQGIELCAKGKEYSERVNRAMDYQINWVLEHSTWYFDDDSGNKEFPFTGMTKMAGGVINDKFKGMDWPEIYHILEMNDDKDKQKPVVYDDDIETKQSDDWYNGFLEGYNSVIEEMRNNGVIESSQLKAIYADCLNENNMK
jgi:predicted metal-dependent peptidase